MIERQPEGEYLVSVLALPGCCKEGSTVEEAQEMAADADGCPGVFCRTARESPSRAAAHYPSSASSAANHLAWSAQIASVVVRSKMN